MTATTGYAARAERYADEIADVPMPDALHALLGPGVRVAELPSGSGHFLATYAASGASTTLIDASPDMLDAAIVHAAKLGVPRPQTICRRAQDLVPEHGHVDLVVVTNGALNQLAAQMAPADVLTAARTILTPGGLLLAQILPPPGTAAADRSCGFYDPTQTDGHWVPDRELRDETGRRLTRRRCQHHDGALVHIDFELTCDGETTPRSRHSVELRLLTAREIYTAAAVAGLTVASMRPGTGGLHEIVATRPARRSR